MLTDAIRQWATPIARDAKGSSLRRLSLPNQGIDFHRAQATAPDGSDGSRKVVLNPAFVEALMGWPSGWTDPFIGASACACAATESCPSKPPEPSSSSQGGS